MRVLGTVSGWTLRLLPACVPAAVFCLPLQSKPARAQDVDLMVAMTQSPANPVLAGVRVTYEVIVRTKGTQPSPSADVSVALPNGLTDVRAGPVTGGQYTCQVSPPGVATTRVTCTRPQLSGTDRVQISARVPQTVPEAGQDFTAGAAVDPLQRVGEASELNNVATLTTRVESGARADLDVEASGSLTAEAGGEVRYLVELRNTGDRGTGIAAMRAELDPGVAFVRTELLPATAVEPQNPVFSGCSPSGQLITCTTNSTVVGQSQFVRVVGRVTAGVPDGQLIYFGVTADPTNAISELSEFNNTAAVITTVRSRSDLRISATATEEDAPCCPGVSQSGSPPRKGTKVTLRITVTNDGPGAALTTTVRVEWPTGFLNKFDLHCIEGTHFALGTCVPGRVTNCFDSCPVRYLFPGESQVITTFAILPKQEGISSTIAIIRATVDPTNAIQETSDSNNAVTLNVSITHPF